MPCPDPMAIPDEDFKKAGFNPAARFLPRDEFAMGLLCAFNGVDPAKAPPAWWFHPNNSTKEAWKRVADYAQSVSPSTLDVPKE